MFKLIRFGVQVFPLKLKCHIRDQINTIEALWAKACFCSGDKYDTNVNLGKNTKQKYRFFHPVERAQKMRNN